MCDYNSVITHVIAALLIVSCRVRRELWYLTLSLVGSPSANDLLDLDYFRKGLPPNSVTVGLPRLNLRGDTIVNPLQLYTPNPGPICVSWLFTHASILLRLSHSANIYQVGLPLCNT